MNKLHSKLNHKAISPDQRNSPLSQLFSALCLIAQSAIWESNRLSGKQLEKQAVNATLIRQWITNPSLGGCRASVWTSSRK